VTELERKPKPEAQEEAVARGGRKGPAARHAAPPPQSAPGPPRNAQRPAPSRADPDEGEGRRGRRGGRGVRPHLMSSACIDVRPARLVERAAAPSGPMLFELRKSEGEEAEGLEESTGPGGYDTPTGPAGRHTGGKYSGYSGRPTTPTADTLAPAVGAGQLSRIWFPLYPTQMTHTRACLSHECAHISDARTRAHVRVTHTRTCLSHERSQKCLSHAHAHMS
jgi:hypothetical protein